MLDYLIDHPETVGIDMELPLWASQVKFYTVLRIRDVYPGSRILIFYPSRIPDPTTVAKEEGEKFFVLPFFVATNITKFKIIFFELVKENFSPVTKNYCAFLPINLSLSFQKYGFGIRDSGSGILKKSIPDLGFRG
jgi:hypothetical protein